MLTDIEIKYSKKFNIICTYFILQDIRPSLMLLKIGLTYAKNGLEREIFEIVKSFYYKQLIRQIDLDNHNADHLQKIPYLKKYIFLRQNNLKNELYQR